MNFDAEFTGLPPKLSTVDRRNIQDVDQSVFQTFGCINPRAHEIVGVKHWFMYISVRLDIRIHDMVKWIFSN